MKTPETYSPQGYRTDPEKGVVFGRRGRPLTARKPEGYVFASSNGRLVGYAHRMIWESVNGKIPDGLQINHINGIKSDNRIANLEVVTVAENVDHAIRTGLSDMRGERHPNTKLTNSEVIQIRSHSEAGATLGELAQMFDVTPRTIRGIVTRQNWNHL